MSKISVAVISSFIGKSPKNIAYSFVFDEVYKLFKRGVNIHIIRSIFEGDSISYGMYYHGLEKIIDIRIIELTLKIFHVYPSISLLRNPVKIYWENLYASKVIKVVDGIHIDLIHAHFAYPEGFIAYLVKNKRRKPLIITVHGYDILTEPSVKYGIRLSRRYDSLVRRALNSADAVIVASRATYTEVRKIVNIPSKIYLIPNGVDINKFNPHLDGSTLRKRLNIDESATVVFTLRLHEPQYGIEYLIRAIPLVLNENKDVVFVIGGSGSLKRYHELLANKLGIREKVIFVGKIQRTEVPYYYAMSDLVVVPSLQEAFGLSVTEAMASGKAVIGSKVGGIVDQIIDGYNGFLVNPKDPYAIAEKILYFCENLDEIKKMGNKGRKLAEEKFDINKRIDKIIALYNRLLYS